MDNQTVDKNFEGQNSSCGRKRNVQEYLESCSEQDSYEKWFKQANGGSRLQYFEEDFMKIEGDISVFVPPSRSLRSDNNQRAEAARENVGKIHDMEDVHVGGARGNMGETGGAKRNVGGDWNTKSGTVPDPPLPKELLEQFQPLYCKLCQLKMTSNAMATMHYKSKNHDKKIRKFLLDDAEKRGVAPHPFATRIRQNEEVEKNPRYFHCDVCDLPLTGKLHAESHYMGKQHNAVVMGKRLPSGRGRYDGDTGKWKRDKFKRVEYDGVNDNFGLAFRTQNTETSMVSGNSSKTSVVSGNSSKTSISKEPLKCSICDVFCTGQEQMTMHLNGSKHRKKLKSMGVCPEDVGLTGENLEIDIKPDPVQLTSEFSRYKTPSGQFYCRKCNLSLNSDLQLTQHLNSKNHAKKST